MSSGALSTGMVVAVIVATFICSTRITSGIERSTGARQSVA
jgi:hypothetical protein